MILILIFLCLSYSCDGKFHSQIAVKIFSSTKRGCKCTLVQSESCFNLPYRQSFFFFFTAEQHNYRTSRSHPLPGRLAQVCKTCQGFDWCKLDPIYIVWLILTLKCSEHVFRISYCCLHKNNYLNWLLTWKTVVLYVTGWANTKPLLLLLPTSQWWCTCTKGIDCTLNLVNCYSGGSRGGAQMTPPPPLIWRSGSANVLYA